MKILVTGASGFIGDHILAELKKNHKLAVLVLPSEKIRNGENVEIFTGDVTKPETLEKACQWPDMVIHIAGLIKAPTTEDYYRVNDRGTANMVDVLGRVNPKLKLFVLFSSLSVAGKMQNTSVPIDESHPSNPIDHYARSKYQAEQHLANAPFKYTILRLPSVFGGGSIQYITLMRLAKNFRIQPQLGSKGNNFSMIYVEDLAKCVSNLVDKHDKLKHNLYYLADTITGHHTKEITRSVSSLFPHRVFTITVPVALLKAIGYVVALVGKITGKSFLLNPEQVQLLVTDFVCNPGRFQKDFGIDQYTSLAEGMKNSLEWYKKEKWL